MSLMRFSVAGECRHAGTVRFRTGDLEFTWTEDNLLRQLSYQAQREDKPPRQVVRPVPHPDRPRR